MKFIPQWSWVLSNLWYVHSPTRRHVIKNKNVIFTAKTMMWMFTHEPAPPWTLINGVRPIIRQSDSPIIRRSDNPIDRQFDSPIIRQSDKCFISLKVNTITCVIWDQKPNRLLTKERSRTSETRYHRRTNNWQGHTRTKKNPHIWTTQTP